MKRGNIRLLAVAVVVAAGLTITAAAQAWQRGQLGDPVSAGPAYNDRTARVCRDGLILQVASSENVEYTLVVTSGGNQIASRSVTLERRTVSTPPFGQRRFSRTVSLSFNTVLPAGATVTIGFEGFNTFDATVRNCRLFRDEDEDEDDDGDD